MMPLQIAFVGFGGLARGLWSTDQSNIVILGIIAVTGSVAFVVAKRLARLKSSSLEDSNE